MSKNLIYDIKETMNMHYLDSVSIFTHKKNKNKSVAAGLALAHLLNSIGIRTNVIVHELDGLTLEDELIQRKPISEHFLAISVDNKRITDIENKVFQNSFVLLYIYGPTNSKGFGILNYAKPDVSGSAEILYHEIKNYCDSINKKIPKEVAMNLYVSLLAGTKQFSTNIKKQTFTIAKELLQNEIDIHSATYAISKKTDASLNCQELILKEMTKADKYAYSIIPKAESNKYNTQHFLDALSSFRNVGNICVWALFLEREETYDVILQSNNTYLYNVSKIAKKNSGDGDEIDAIAHIQKFDINKVISDIQLLFN